MHSTVVVHTFNKSVHQYIHIATTRIYRDNQCTSCGTPFFSNGWPVTLAIPLQHKHDDQIIQIILYRNFIYTMHL